MKAEGVRRLPEEKYEVSRGSSMRFKVRKYCHDIKEQGEEADADEKAAASYAENLAQIINKYGYTTIVFQCG